MEIPPLCLRETRSGRNVQHELVSLLRQSVYSRLAGYEDINDRARLAHNLAMQAVVSPCATQKQTASTNILSRFRTEVLVTDENLRGFEQLNVEWVDGAVALTKHQRIIPDISGSGAVLLDTQGRWQGLLERWLTDLGREATIGLSCSGGEVCLSVVEMGSRGLHG